MKQTTATVVFIMLAMAGSFESAKAFPSLWSDYYRNALYGRKSAAARMQQDSQQCLTGEAPASIPCQSARLTTGTRNTFVHVCPGDPGKQFHKNIISPRLHDSCIADAISFILYMVFLYEISAWKMHGYK